MRTMMKMIGCAAVALLMGAGAANAQCHVGLQVGGSIASTQLSSTGGGGAIDGIGMRSSRPDAGVHGGCDLSIAKPVVVGLWGSWTDQDVKFNITPGVFSASLGNSYAGGARLGYMVGTSMPYVVVGVAHTDVSYSTAITGAPSSFTGLVLGGGVEMPLRDRFSLAVEADWTRYQSQSISGAGVDLRPDALQAMLRVNYNFGGEPARAAPLK